MAELAENNKTGPQDQTAAPATPKDRIAPRRRRKGRRYVVIFLIVAVLAVGGYYLWRYFSTYEDTDDAQIDGHVNPISARITGHLVDVLVNDAQHVKAGEVLARIDPRDYEVALEQAEADLHNYEASLGNSRLQVPITTRDTGSQLKSANASKASAEAALESAQQQLKASQDALETAQYQVTQAEATHKTDTDNVGRYKLLVDKNEIARQIYDTTVDQAAADQATVEARKAAVRQAEQNVRVQQAAIQQAQQQIVTAEASIEAALTGPEQVSAREAQAKSAAAQVEQRKAAVDQAKLNLSYCTIVSPVTGIVGKKTTEVGQNVSPGQQLMAVVPLDDIWVTANFKETQLQHMRAGQRVTFTVDAYDRVYKARVTGIGGASGSRFSILPPENATGNYVKVVQRIPVRIDLDPGENADQLLRVGMSVEPKVYLH
ncbi:MAG TPA: HlyD family secretion protein [Bryobacteraceae bacterium]